MSLKNLLLNIRISEKDMEKLEYYCEVEKVSKSEFIRDALDLKYNIINRSLSVDDHWY